MSSIPEWMKRVAKVPDIHNAVWEIAAREVALDDFRSEIEQAKEYLRERQDSVRPT